MRIPIAGFQKVSLIDYPSHISAIVFLQGCNMRCPYCHNAVLVPSPSETDEVYQQRQEALLSYLEERKDVLEGVCITGGEPTMSVELPVFIKALKRIGYKIKLDTNGTNPEMLLPLFTDRLVDYVAMDIKTSFERYALVGITSQTLIDNIKKSILLIKEHSPDYEFRTTLEPNTVSLTDISSMGAFIKGARRWALQAYRPDVVLDESRCSKRTYSPQEAMEFSEKAGSFAKEVILRGYGVAVES